MELQVPQPSSMARAWVELWLRACIFPGVGKRVWIGRLGRGSPSTLLGGLRLPALLALNPASVGSNSAVCGRPGSRGPRGAYREPGEPLPCPFRCWPRWGRCEGGSVALQMPSPRWGRAVSAGRRSLLRAGLCWGRSREGAEKRPAVVRLSVRADAVFQP